MQQNPSETRDLIFRVVLLRIGVPRLLNCTAKERERRRGKQETETADQSLVTDTGRLRAHELLSSPFTRLPPFHPRLCARGAHARAAAAFSPSEASKRKRWQLASVCVGYVCFVQFKFLFVFDSYYVTDRHICVIWHGRKCAKSASFISTIKLSLLVNRDLTKFI